MNQLLIKLQKEKSDVTWVTGIWALAGQATTEGFWTTLMVLATPIIHSSRDSFTTIPSPAVLIAVVYTSTEMAIASSLAVNTICLKNITTTVSWTKTFPLKQEAILLSYRYCHLLIVNREFIQNIFITFGKSMQDTQYKKIRLFTVN